MLAWLRKIPVGVAMVLLAAAIHLGTILPHWHDVPLAADTAIGSSDPDPWLRLSIVRDWLTGGSWYDHTIARSNAPFGGIASPWTRPLDVVIAGLVKLQPRSVDLDTRLVRAAMLVPWVFMLLLMAGMVRAVGVLTPIPIAQAIGVALTAAIPLMWNYFSLAYADHHSMLAALFVWVVGELLRPPSHRGMLISGVLLGVMLWVSPEALALIGMIYAWYGLAWLRGDHLAMRYLPTLTSSVAMTTLIAVMIERPVVGWLTPVYDSVSVVYVFILAGAMLIAWALRFLNSETVRTRLAMAVVSLVWLVVMVWCVYPLAFKGPLAEADPYIFTDFLPSIHEAQTEFLKNWVLVISMLMQPALALYLCVESLRRRNGWLVREMAEKLSFFYGFVLLLFLVQVRWNYYLYPLVVLVIVPWLVTLFSPEHPFTRNRWPATWVARYSPHRQMMYRIPIMLAVFFLPIGVAAVVPDDATPAQKQFYACSESARKFIQGGHLARLGHGKPLILFAHTNWGGEILFWTPHRIIASNYHREGVGIKYLWEADAITDAQALRIYLAKRRVDAVITCSTGDPPEGSLLHALQQGQKPPAWLTRVAWETQAEDSNNSSSTDAVPGIFLARRR